MNQDDFLYRYQEAPTEAFSSRLKKQLAAENNQLARSNVTFMRQRLAWVALVLTMALGVSLFVPFGTNSTLAQSLQRWVAGLEFRQVDSLPTHQTLPEGEYVVQQVPEKYEFELAQAQQTIPFLMPTWLPDGYQLSAVTRIEFGEETPNPQDDVTTIDMVWLNQDQQIVMSVTMREVPMLVDNTAAIEELDVNGLPVALHRGLWDAEVNKVVLPEYKTLLWESDGIYYSLSGYDSAFSTEEAVMIIESIHSLKN